MQSGGNLLGAVLLPFLGTAIVPGISRFLRDKLGYALALIPLAIFLLFAPLATSSEPIQHRIPWAPDLGLELAFRLDRLSIPFVLLISIVGVAVFSYSAAYLGKKSSAPRFLATLMSFMGAMLGLVLTDNVLAMFIFWELTSITSFLLIGFDHEEANARRSARQAFVVTFGGGLALLSGLLLLGHVTQTYDVSQMVARAPQVVASPIYPWIVACVCLGAFAKSAQFPFHFWLPNAMAAPTPVSAFLHSATMVQAGVYVLARLTPVLGGPPLWDNLLTGVGAFTAVLGGILCLFNHELKKVLAYTTVGALGLLIACIGQEAEAAFLAFFLAHGLYKGAMFLIAGIIDHGTGIKDIRLLHGLRHEMPRSALVALIAALSMASVPPLFGFVAKELLFHAGSPLLLWVALFYGGTSFAGAYLVGVKPFWGRIKGHGHDPSFGMLAGPAVLGILGIGLGILSGPVGNVFSPSLQFGKSTPVAPAAWHFLPGTATDILLTLASVLIGIFFAFLWHRRLSEGIPGPSLDRLYTRLGNLSMNLAGRLSRLIQHGGLNGYLRTIAATLVLLVAWGLARNLPTLSPLSAIEGTAYELALVVAMIVGAFAAAVTTSRLGAVAALGIVGYGVSLVYVQFGAPDLAMTQVAVETLTLILIVFTFFHLPRWTPRRNPACRFRDGVVAAAAGLTFGVLTFIASSIPHDSGLANFYAENSVPGGKGHNIVNVILVEFRGVDTLGEITVLAVASLGVFSLLTMRAKKGGSSSRP